MTVTINATELRRLAEQATPGPWRVAAVGPQAVYPDPSTHPGVATVPAIAYQIQQPRNAAYIAAASPDVILSLLDERDWAVSERDATVALNHPLHLRVAALEEALRGFVGDAEGPDGVGDEEQWWWNHPEWSDDEQLLGGTVGQYRRATLLLQDKDKVTP